VGCHPAAKSVFAPGEALDDGPRLHRLDGGAGDRRSRDPDTIDRSGRHFHAGYKGATLSFRSWDGQLRQPVLLADARALVSVSPQPGFLHQFSELDTLGIDKPETKCRMQ
jgi:ABC transporter substrate binding protein (PQQ-dependent alcohol dehydrogenase system)